MSLLHNQKERPLNGPFGLFPAPEERVVNDTQDRSDEADHDEIGNPGEI